MFSCLQSLHWTDSLNRTEKRLFSPFAFGTDKCVNTWRGDTCPSPFYSLFTLELTIENKPVRVFFNLVFPQETVTQHAFCFSAAQHSVAHIRVKKLKPRPFSCVQIALLKGTSVMMDSDGGQQMFTIFKARAGFKLLTPPKMLPSLRAVQRRFQSEHRVLLTRSLLMKKPASSSVMLACCLMICWTVLRTSPAIVTSPHT